MTNRSARTVSITGATGFVGSHLAEAFRDAGWHVRAIVRPGNRKPLPDGIAAAESPLDAAALTRAVTGSTLVVHAAGITRATRPSIFEAVNIRGTVAVVEAANATSARLILISSQAAAGPGTADRPTREDDPPRPLTSYGRSKLAAEAAVRAGSRVPSIIVRPSAVYGPRDRGFLPLFRLASRGRFPVIAKSTAGFTLMHVDDLACAVVLAATSERASGETLFLGHRIPLATEDVLRGLARAFSVPYKPRRVPTALVRAAAYVGEISWMIRRQPMIDASRLRELSANGFVCSVDRARDVLGFTAAVDWTEGAERTARWYRDQGWV